jgi:hypothetical protein
MADNYWVPMRLPSPKEIAKYALWGTGRVILSGWLFGLFGVAVVCKVTINVAEMTKQTTLQLLKVYDQLLIVRFLRVLVSVCAWRQSL